MKKEIIQIVYHKHKEKMCDNNKSAFHKAWAMDDLYVIDYSFWKQLTAHSRMNSNDSL